jgi:hypothetical protein
LDSALEDGLIKDIPVIGTVFGIGKIYLSITDKLFSKKLMLFIYEIKDIPVAKRTKIIEKIQNENKFGSELGEKILMIIDKTNDSIKATWIGKLFFHCLKEEIQYKEFLRCSDIINLASFQSIKEIITSSYEEIPIDQEDDFISSGLFKIEPPKIELKKTENLYEHFREGADLKTEYSIKEPEWSAVITEYGKILRKYLK